MGNWLTRQARDAAVKKAMEFAPESEEHAVRVVHRRTKKAGLVNHVRECDGAVVVRWDEAPDDLDVCHHCTLIKDECVTAPLPEPEPDPEPAPEPEPAPAPKRGRKKKGA